jgi:hypothetical protein
VVKQAIKDQFEGLGTIRRVTAGDIVYASQFYAPVVTVGGTTLESVLVKTTGAYGISQQVDNLSNPTVADVVVTLL